MLYTKTRQKVIDYLSARNQAYTPYEIANGVNMNPVTVYRILNFLKEKKLVHHIPTLGKWSACRCLNTSEDHGFLICRKCEKVEEFLSPHQCFHSHGFHCEEHITEVMWICQKCIQK